MPCIVTLMVLAISAVPLPTAQPSTTTRAINEINEEISGRTADHAQTDPSEADPISVDRRITLMSETGWKIQILAAVLIIGQAIVIVALLLQARRRRLAQRTLLDRQEDLRSNQARYALATTAGAVGVWDWNFETNELFIDPVLKQLLGFEDGEISTRPDDWGGRVHPDDVSAAAAGIKTCLDGFSDVYEIEHRMLHKNGSVRWMLSRGSAIRSTDGTLRRLVGTKVDITQRRQNEEIIRESQAAQRHSHKQIQELAGQLIASQEVERARLARDLHDDVSQQVAALAISLRGLKSRLALLPSAADAVREVAVLQGRAVGLADSVRRLSHDLHPSMLERVGLIAALSDHCAEIERLQLLAVAFTAEGDFSTIAPDSALCLYRVVQEGLRNVVSHSNAGRAEVSLRTAGDQADLSIADDGQGFDVVEAGKRRRGLGLVSITERVRLAGGTVSIVSELNTGTRVHVQIPFNPDAINALRA